MSYINIWINRDEIKFKIYKFKNGEEKIIIQDKIISPRSFDIGNRLNYLRKMLEILIKQYSIDKARLNIEDNIKKDLINIIKMEGMLEELLSNCGVEICK
ncbi:hypothetical protein CHF27_002205 [Romboutsia maritimum]|uniref:Uncharacterized protein n=1 Tax=Romboutsia maritimum TaxID=2020948 RepID=A0A371IVF7_9FIRM|nr:hypothetical protein [Romboutsia maritimum]RDY24472.1 hypothetical protein CHF27_002205 [Romboutsia maritimum]